MMLIKREDGEDFDRPNMGGFRHFRYRFLERLNSFFALHKASEACIWNQSIS